MGDRAPQHEVERVYTLHKQGLSNRIIAERMGWRQDDTGQAKIRRILRKRAKAEKGLA